MKLCNLSSVELDIFVLNNRYMNSKIREKRRIPFNLKRITPKIIRAFSSIIEDEIENLDNEQRDKFFKIYSVDANGNESFESQSNVIFSCIENRMVRKIFMQFYTLDNSKNIEIQIVDSVKDDDLENFLMVSGDNPTWVNGILTRLVAILNTAENQPKISNSSGWIVFGLFVLFNVEYFRLFFNYFPKDIELLFTLFIFGVPFLSFILALKFHNYIETLWPSVELQTGPDYQRIPNRRRTKLQWMAVSVILPLLLSVVYDVVKSIL